MRFPRCPLHSVAARLVFFHAILWPGVGLADDVVFSGPQAGEKTTPFKVLEVSRAAEPAERDPIAENAGAPTALVFLHGLERSMVPLLRVVDEYGAQRKDRLKTEVIFLAADRLAGEQRLNAAAGSLKLRARVGLSLDGAEGPGNYGLNGQCLMTIVLARDNQVIANFALVQPGIAHAPAIIKALAETCGDAAPPSVEQLTANQAERAGAGRGRDRMLARDAAAPVDFYRLDLSTDVGLREAVRGLMAEVTRLRADVTELRGKSGDAAGTPAPKPAQEPFPGAVPTDEKLQGLLRRFIRPTNDDATVDQVLAEVEGHIRGNPDLRQQAIDGWTRILHFGDRYGTPHAREAGRAFLERLKKE